MNGRRRIIFRTRVVEPDHTTLEFRKIGRVAIYIGCILFCVLEQSANSGKTDLGISTNGVIVGHHQGLIDGVNADAHSLESLKGRHVRSRKCEVGEGRQVRSGAEHRHSRDGRQLGEAVLHLGGIRGEIRA